MRKGVDYSSLLPQAAFQELEPFPSRHTLSSRHQHHYNKIKVQWTAREKEREQQMSLRKKAEGSFSKPVRGGRRVAATPTCGGLQSWAACLERGSSSIDKGPGFKDLTFWFRSRFTGLEKEII